MKTLETILGTIALTTALTTSCATQQPTPITPQQEEQPTPICNGMCGPKDAPKKKQQTFTTLYKDNNAYAPHKEKTTGFVINNQQSLDELYEKMNFSFSFDAEGKKYRNLPAYTPDFSKEMVIAVFQGKRPHTGYGIEITHIVEQAGTIFVAAQLQEPRGEGFHAQVTQAPAHLVVYHKTEKPAVFVWNTKNPLAERSLPTKYLLTNPKPLEYNIPPKATREETIQIYENIRQHVHEQFEQDAKHAGVSIEKFIGTHSFVAPLDPELIPYFEKKGYTVQKIGIETVK